MTEAWAAKSGQFQGQSPVNGSVVLTFNASLPTVVAAVLKVTDVELQAGETVTSVNIGDNARWTVAVTNSNDGELQRPHLIIKPLDEGLQTTLVVTTSRRSYHLFLQSNLERFMHYVTFEYPEDPEMAALQRRRAQEEEALRSQFALTRTQSAARLPKPISPGPPLASVAYRIEGEAPWQPLYAYTDGRKTYIQMPATMSQTEAPSLLALRRGKGLWGEDKVIVNYRVAYGQSRVFIAWQRVIYPDGRALEIGAQPGTDGGGYAGFSDQVDNHYARVFGSAVLMSAIVGGVAYSQQLGQNTPNPNNGTLSNSASSQNGLTQALSQSLGVTFGNVITNLIQKNLNIAPTLKIRPGYRFNILVVKDFDLTPYEDFQFSRAERTTHAAPAITTQIRTITPTPFDK